MKEKFRRNGGTSFREWYEGAIASLGWCGRGRGVIARNALVRLLFLTTIEISEEYDSRSDNMIMRVTMIMRMGMRLSAKNLA